MSLAFTAKAARDACAALFYRSLSETHLQDGHHLHSNPRFSLLVHVALKDVDNTAEVFRRDGATDSHEGVEGVEAAERGGVIRLRLVLGLSYYEERRDKREAQGVNTRC